MFGMHKGTTPAVASNWNLKKTKNLPFYVGNRDLKTVNVDLLQRLCGTVVTSDMMSLALEFQRDSVNDG